MGRSNLPSTLKWCHWQAAQECQIEKSRQASSVKGRPKYWKPPWKHGGVWWGQHQSAGQRKTMAGRRFQGNFPRRGWICGWRSARQSGRLHHRCPPLSVGAQCKVEPGKKSFLQLQRLNRCESCLQRLTAKAHKMIMTNWCPLPLFEITMTPSFRMAPIECRQASLSNCS